MKAKDLLKGFGKDVLPALVGTLGTPFAGIATKFLAEKLLGKSEAEAEELSMAVQGADITKLREVEMDFQKHIATLGITMEQIRAADVANARARDVAFVNAGRDNLRADVIVYGTMTLLALCVGALVFLDIPGGNRELLATLVGALILAYRQVTTFEFGIFREQAGRTKIEAFK